MANVTRDDTMARVPAQWQLLRQSAAQPAAWLALARSYAADGLPWQAEYAGRQARRLDPALGQSLQALGIGTGADPSASDALLGRATLPESAALAERFHTSLKRTPGDWLTWLYLARLLEMAPAAPSEDDKTSDNDNNGDGAAPEERAPGPPTASVALERACALEPIAGESQHWMGVWRLNAGDAQGCIAALSALIDIRPLRFGSMMYLGEALLRGGQGAAAEKAFARASLSPNPDFLQTLAARVYTHNYWQEAIAILQKALTIAPASVPGWLALATIESEVYALADCRASLRQIAALDADNGPARLLFAGLQGRMGDARGHLATLQGAYEAGGDPLSRLASSIAMTALYHDLMAPAAVAALHRRLCAPIEAAVAPRTDFSNLAMPERPLRIGWVTGDLHRQHPVNIFVLPLLLRFDQARFECAIYYTGSMHDDYTRQARDCVTRWTEASGLDDNALQQAILADQIDILIDLAGHTSTHRLGVFALRAAPVQASFLGYPHSTGLAAIDWLIGDATVSPEQHAHLFSEGIAQLPGSVFCWAPVDDYPLPPPRPAEAPLVFGSFNNAMKITPTTIALWAAVLLAVPHAQLLLKAPSFRDTEVQERFAALFAEHGIARERLSFRGPNGLADMMQEYGDIDIALDPTPYNGGTTTLQALWMGVPVLVLEGANFVSRMGASFMRTLGRPEWIADDEAAYVSSAVDLARDCAGVRGGRAALRAQMAASPLADMDAYVAHFQTLLRRMWRAHCDNDGVRLIRADDASPTDLPRPAHPLSPGSSNGHDRPHAST